MAYKRKTRDEWTVQGNYSWAPGWEDECSVDNRKDARQRLREYRENGPGMYRLIKRRVPLEVAA